MSEPLINHEMLIANAGSGKTYRLTVRMITLLGMGVAPSKIAALTFTRKAAGEFMEAVFRRLAKAATDDGEIEKLQRDTGLQKLDAEMCRSMLVSLAGELNRLCMGTIDSLFGRIARAFPVESGLSGDFSVLGDAGLEQLRRNVLAEMFREQAGRNLREFLDLVRRQNLKDGERSAFESLLKSASELHAKYLRTPVGIEWGDRNLIWPAGCAILRSGEPAAAADALWAAIEATHPDLDESAAIKWRANLDLARAARAGQPMSKDLSKFVAEKLCVEREYIPTGNRGAARVYLNDQVRAARLELLHALLKFEIETLLSRSAALYRVMCGFEATYFRIVRSQGLLTFGDITDLLAAQVDEPDWRAAVGYRLDARFDHWLLDEFQDTSRPQWRVLGGLIDEVVQDTSETRSFFYVGDTKQALYSWRGGDPKLFFEIREKYNQGAEGPICAAAPLSQSHRSDPEIVEVVNQVFGNLKSVAETLALPARTVADWEQAWTRHEVADHKAAQAGYVRWMGVDKDSAFPANDEEEEASPQDREILALLNEVEPWKRGWSCAALKRDNAKVTALASLLESQGIPVAVEGKANPCTDNPLGAALLAAFRVAASPGDTLSAGLLSASALGNALLAKDVFAFRESALRTISREGYAAAARRWLAQLDLSQEPFLEARAAEFLGAAGEFDATRRPPDGIGDFINHIEGYTRQEPEGAGVVRVMTVHQAKGLTFDMVIVSGLDALAKDRSPGSLALASREHGGPWGMLMPASECAKADDTLGAARMRMLAESAYGELCAAYVAMTRPRHALYLLTKKLGDNTTSKGFARLLRETLGASETGFECGDSKWYARPQATVSAGAGASPTHRELPPQVAGTPHAISPSSPHPVIGSAVGPPAARPAYFSADAATLGTEIHAALAQVEWLGDAPPPEMSGISREAQQLLTRFLAGPAANRIFRKPQMPCRVWRERSFDLVLDGQWFSGAFDRVRIALDSGGAPAAAVIYDFKTDRADAAELERRHGAQMAVYRRAAATLLGIQPTAVESEIVPVRS